MAVVDRIVFTESMMRAFADASHDINPLHTDAVYAARTPFGFPVVYGVLGLLAAMRNVLRTLPIRITRLRADFIRPLYVGETYAVDVSASATRGFLITLIAGDVIKQRIELDYQPWSATAGPVNDVDVPARTLAANPTMAALAGSVHVFRYRPAASAVNALFDALGLPPERLPAVQLATLLWSSYFIGMEVPGTQALYVRLEATFSDDVPACWGLDGDVRVVSADTASGFVVQDAAVRAEALPVAGLRLEALRRPEPVQYPVDRLVKTASGLTGLRGKRVLVTGASRGIGSLLATGAGAAGAEVFVHYRRSQTEAGRVVDRILGAGGKAVAIGGDLRDPASWSTIKRQVQRSGPGLDLFIHSAFTPILPRSLMELSVDTLRQDFETNVLPLVSGLQLLLPMVRRVRGRVALISSVWVDEPPAEFSAYVAQKAALEALLSAAAREVTDAGFLALRLPRVLSDQTNVNLDTSPPADAVGVAFEVLQQLAGATDSGFRVIHPGQDYKS